MSVIAEALTPEEVAEVEAQLGLSGSSNLPPIISSGRKPSARTTITYDELLAFRELEVPLQDFYVRVSNGSLGGLVPATKVAKWIGQGYTPE